MFFGLLLSFIWRKNSFEIPGGYERTHMESNRSSGDFRMRSRVALIEAGPKAFRNEDTTDMATPYAPFSCKILGFLRNLRALNLTHSHPSSLSSNSKLCISTGKRGVSLALFIFLSLQMCFFRARGLPP